MNLTIISMITTPNLQSQENIYLAIDFAFFHVAQRNFILWDIAKVFPYHTDDLRNGMPSESRRVELSVKYWLILSLAPGLRYW